MPVNRAELLAVVVVRGAALVCALVVVVCLVVVARLVVVVCLVVVARLVVVVCLVVVARLVVVVCLVVVARLVVVVVIRDEVPPHAGRPDLTMVAFNVSPAFTNTVPLPAALDSLLKVGPVITLVRSGVPWTSLTGPPPTKVRRRK
jgi:hypothetical protein